jgi:hypothetical protein
MIPTRASAEVRELYVSRILAAYERATADQRERGRNWYPVAHDLARMLADGDVVRGAGVIAALSPQKEWQLNVRMAKAALAGQPVGHLADALRKVAAIMAGADPLDVLPVALKTGNFYRNILDPADPDPVTIDRHAHDVAAGVPYQGVGGKDTYGSRGLSNVTRYALLAHCYREAAMRLGILPSVLQATTWLVQTESKVNGQADAARVSQAI